MAEAAIDPELAAALDRLPESERSVEYYDFDQLDRTRAFEAAMSPGLSRSEAEARGVRIEDIPLNRDAVGPKRIRLYRTVVGAEPAPAARPALPALLWIHGGGMVSGAPEQDDAHMTAYVRALGIVIASVDYRLAPEHPHPAPVDDCFAAFGWLVDHAADLGVDPDRIAVGGSSAGGGLAAGLALMARDAGGPVPMFQLLVHPMLDDRTAHHSVPDVPDLGVWDRAMNVKAWDALLPGQRASASVSPYAAPARAVNLAGLPAAYLDVGSVDLFVAEDIDYAHRLEAAGVEVELRVHAGAYHGFDDIAPDAALSRSAELFRIDALRRAFGADD